MKAVDTGLAQDNYRYTSYQLQFTEIKIKVSNLSPYRYLLISKRGVHGDAGSLRINIHLGRRRMTGSEQGGRVGSGGWEWERV